MNNILRFIPSALLTIAGTAGHTARQMLMVAMVLIAAGTATDALAQGTQTTASPSTNPSVNGQTITLNVTVTPDVYLGDRTGAVEVVVNGGTPIPLTLTGTGGSSVASTALTSNSAGD